jgi:phosphohistidine phosphatase SixA
MRLLVLLLSLLLACPPAARAQTDEAGLWSLLGQGGQVLLLRHALAPGVGDPPGLRLDDCSTQRNLSELGRQQARAIGQRFAAERVPVELTLTSAWCRCAETAALAFGQASVWPALNSFFADRTDEPAQTAELRAGVARWSGAGNLVLVTHQVNITALTGIVPESGEAVVLTPAPNTAVGFTIAGRLKAD